MGEPDNSDNVALLTYSEFKQLFGCGDEEVERYLFESCCQTIANCAAEYLAELPIWCNIRDVAEVEGYEYTGRNAVVNDDGKEDTIGTGDDGVPNGEDWVSYLDEWIIFYLKSMDLAKTWMNAEEGVTLYEIIANILGDGKGLLNCIY